MGELLKESCFLSKKFMLKRLLSPATALFPLDTHKWYKNTCRHLNTGPVVYISSWLPCPLKHTHYVLAWNKQPVFPHPVGLLPACTVHVCVLTAPALQSWFSHHAARRAGCTGNTLTSHPPATSAQAQCHSAIAPFCWKAHSMRAFMSSKPCHGFSYEFISQAGLQGMFNLAPAL